MRHGCRLTITFVGTTQVIEERKSGTENDGFPFRLFVFVKLKLIILICY
ncbi:hypothetical protein NBRC111894_3706 [Sporolactobacillus inulinus]|uniref:Uncharacterized protein n=1 Tax=Sporolactobacillus inulinus TaxID=2078 RepID=A0A4Y1ZG50_9BACL|nr:hypothetical protein NBRC111894_3706 [Sporolactobacillus inulinus]